MHVDDGDFVGDVGDADFVGDADLAFFTLSSCRLMILSSALDGFDAYLFLYNSSAESSASKEGIYIFKIYYF